MCRSYLYRTYTSRCSCDALRRQNFSFRSMQKSHYVCQNVNVLAFFFRFIFCCYAEIHHFQHTEEMVIIPEFSFFFILSGGICMYNTQVTYRYMYFSLNHIYRHCAYIMLWNDSWCHGVRAHVKYAPTLKACGQSITNKGRNK